MPKYYINNYDVKKTVKKPYKKSIENIILTEDSLITIEKDIYEKYKFIKNKDIEILDDFFNSNELLIDYSYFKKIGIVNSIPFNHKKISITYEYYKTNEKSKVIFIMEYINNILKDYYFSAPNNLDFNIVENDILRFLSC